MGMGDSHKGRWETPQEEMGDPPKGRLPKGRQETPRGDERSPQGETPQGEKETPPKGKLETPIRGDGRPLRERWETPPRGDRKLWS